MNGKGLEKLGRVLKKDRRGANINRTTWLKNELRLSSMIPPPVLGTGDVFSSLQNRQGNLRNRVTFKTLKKSDSACNIFCRVSLTNYRCLVKFCLEI